METELNKALSWEIDNSCERIKSEPFSSGGCDWYVVVYPKGYCGWDHLALFLNVVHPESAGTGWKRRARFCFVLLNQSGKELCRSPGTQKARQSGNKEEVDMSLTGSKKLQEEKINQEK